MYLTRMYLNPRRRGTQKFLASPHALHAAVESTIPPSDLAPRGRMLWRVDGQGSDRVTLYVVSAERPDCTCIAEQAGWPTQETWATRSYLPVLDSLEAGEAWRFRLTGNPVHAVRLVEGAPTKRVGHVTAPQQIGWLLQQGQNHGFEIPVGADGDPTVVVSNRLVRNFGRIHAGSRSQVTLSTATFDGILTVVDPVAFRSALMNGIGRAKGYGCGLLTVVAP